MCQPVKNLHGSSRQDTYNTNALDYLFWGKASQAVTQQCREGSVEGTSGLTGMLSTSAHGSHGKTRFVSPYQSLLTLLINPEGQRDDFTPPPKISIPKQCLLPLLVPWNTLFVLFFCLWFPLVTLKWMHLLSHIVISRQVAQKQVGCPGVINMRLERWMRLNHKIINRWLETRRLHLRNIL